MRILFLVHSLECGGVQRVVANLANYWAEKNWDVMIVSFETIDKDFYDLSPCIQRISLNSFNKGNIFTKLKKNLIRVVKFRLIMKKFKPQMTIGFQLPANIVVAIAGYRQKYTKLIGSEHNYPPLEGKSKLAIWLNIKMYQLLDTLTVLTQKNLEWINVRSNFSKVEIIPNSIPASIINQPLPNYLTQHKEQTKFILLAVGRLYYQKGFDLLIPIFSKLSLQFPEWDLIIAGEGPERENLERLIKKYNLEKRVQLLGAVSDVNSLYAGADCFVFSSRYEGFGNVLVEAMASGLPTISFDCDTGPRDIIRHNVDGLLVPAGDTEALYNGLSLLLKDKDLRKRLGKRAVEARERFSPERIAAKWESLFEKLLNENSLSTTCQDQVT